MESKQPITASLFAAMVTPFTESGRINYEAAVSLANDLIESGHQGIVLTGTTGESSTLKSLEKTTLYAEIIQAVGKKAIIFAGVGSNNTEDSTELALQAFELGIHGLMVVTPYYSKPSQLGIISHIKTIAAATPLPVMLYDIPGRSGVALELETILQLAEVSNIVAIKDASANFLKATRIIAETELVYYSGDDALTLPWLSIGAVGLVSVSSHIAGQKYRHMIESFKSGNIETAQKLNIELEPLQRALMARLPAAVAVKQVLFWQKRIPGPHVRLPLVVANEKERTIIRNDLKDVDINI